MWRLKKIEVENFRSYKGSHLIELGDVNILWGRIGAGKTSILYAVEYALFGRQLEVKERIAKLVDLINSESHELKVSVSLQRGGEILQIIRSLNRRGAERLVVKLDGVEYRGKEAEKKLEEALGVDEDIYERLVYMSHRTLEGFIYGTSQKRALSVDKLFGIDVVDNVVRHIASFEKTLIERAEELRKRVASFEKYKDVIRKYGGYRGLQTRLRQLDEEITMLKEREETLTRKVEELAKKRARHIEKLREIEETLIEYYKTKSELEVLETSVGAELDVASVEKLREALRDVLEEFEHLVGPEIAERLAKAGDIETLASTMVEAYDTIARLQKELETQLLDTKRLYDSYTAKLRQVEEDIAGTLGRLRRLEPHYQRFKELQKSLKSLEEAKSALAEKKKRLEKLERAASYSAALRTVAVYLAESGSARCPICGGDIKSEVVTSLVRELESRYGELIKELEDIKSGVEALERAIAEMEALSGDVAEYLAAKSTLSDLQREREELVGKLLSLEKSMKQLERRVEKIRQLLTRIDKRTIYDAVSRYSRGVKVRELRRRVRELEERLKKTGVTEELILLDTSWREAVEELEKTSSRLAEYYRERALLEEVEREVGGDVENLKKQLDDVLHAFSKLQGVKARFELVKINARSRMLEMAKSRFNDVFLSLYRYGDITRVGADLEQRKGYYDFYAIGPSGERYGVSKLSDGQRLSIALALALALREVSKVGVDFIIFDEPIPYVDINIRKAFTDIVKTLAKSRQLIIATQSREFAEMIKEAVPSSKFYTIVKEDSSRVEEERTL